MKKIQKYTVHNDSEKDIDFFVSFDSVSSMHFPFFCPVCDFVMRTQEDFSAFQRFKCCYECEIIFAQPMRDKWDNGWRPSDQELNSYKVRVSEQSLNLFSIDEDN